MKVVACQYSVCLFSSLPDPGLVSNGSPSTGAGDSFPKFSTLRECAGLRENIIMNSGGSSDCNNEY